MLDQVEILLYTAFSAPIDDIFYLPEDHPELALLKANTFEHTVANYKKYNKELSLMMAAVTAAGVAVFKALESENVVKQGLHAATTGAYFMIFKDEGSAQFRYWMAQNKHDAHKINTFFNMQNDNKLVVQGMKVIRDSISINQVLYVPMIAKVFDMEEAKVYETLTDADVLRLSKQTPTLSSTVKYHVNAKQHDPSCQVKVRILYNDRLDVNFKD